MSDDVGRELNIGWKCAGRKMITADGNRSTFLNMVQSVPINVHGIVIPVPIILEKFGSEQVILGRPWETYGQSCERNLDNGSCQITISAIDGSEQVTFVVTFPTDKRGRFAISSGNFYD